jgi:4'-phosphopantetheinyl transferase
MTSAVHVAVGRVPELADVAQGQAPAWLSPGEQARLERLTAATRRMEFIAGRRLARQLLATVYAGAPEQWQMSAPESGRPTVIGPAGVRPYVSLSHSGGHVACAVAPHPLGLDLECDIRPRDFLTLADVICTTAEAARLRAADQCARARLFYECWTLKEAWLKSRGEPLSPARLALIGTEITKDQTTADGRLWHGAGFVLALVASPGFPVRWVGEALPHESRWRITDAAALEA